MDTSLLSSENKMPTVPPKQSELYRMFVSFLKHTEILLWARFTRRQDTLRRGEDNTIAIINQQKLFIANKSHTCLQSQ